MEILRENIVIELKNEEIYKAYRQHLYEMDKELVKSRLMDFLFEDEYESIENKEAFYDEATFEFRKNSSRCDADLEEALRDAVLSTVDRYLPGKIGLCKDFSVEKLDKYICYEYNFVSYEWYDEDTEMLRADYCHIDEFDCTADYNNIKDWSVEVIAKGAKYLFVINKSNQNAMYWIATADTEDITDEDTMLEYIEMHISDWVAVWENSCSNIG